jgi:hypothetical protein
VREIFTRRNMLVHTDGKVTERYIAEVKRGGGSTEGLELGQNLMPTADYLRAALEQLLALEALLTCKVLSHIDKSQAEQVASWLAYRLEWVIQKEMWEAACLIAESFDEVRCKRTTQLMIKVNGWLARKYRYGIDGVRGEVESWDVSGLGDKYRMFKRALLDKLTEDDLRSLLEKGSLTRFEVLSHPMYAGMRERLPALDQAAEKRPELDA